MVQLFLSEFDNVLIDSDEAIPLSTMVEIDRIRRLGVKFGVMSGRNLKSILDYNRDFPFLDYIIASDGAFVYDVDKRKIIYKKNLGVSIIKKILKLYHDEIIFLDSRQESYQYKNNKIYSKIKNRVYEVDEFLELYKKDIYRMEVHFTSKKERDSAFFEIRELQLKVNLGKIDKKKDSAISITSDVVNRAVALEKICKVARVCLDDICCVGGIMEDVPLLLSIPCSYVVSNSPKDVKKCVTKQTSSNETKGVEKIIKKMV